MLFSLGQTLPMPKKVVTLLISIVFSCAAAIGILRYFVPGLFGASTDTRFVQLSQEVPPFFENVFRDQENESKDFLVQDPLSTVRGRPFFHESPGMGPHDVLGFRNFSVPRVADIVSIGDSMTYGNNVLASEAWPKQVLQILGNPQLREYSIATGGWGAVQYWYLYQKALAFSPRVILVAFYTGNDPLESFRDVYRGDLMAEYRPNPDLRLESMPTWKFPPPRSEWWTVELKPQGAVSFTPQLRWVANDPKSPVVKAGYEIMLALAKEMVEMGLEKNVRTVFTIIPTKELVFQKRLIRDGIVLRDDYRSLVEAESEHIASFSTQLQAIPKATYVDVVEPLSQATLGNALTYPPSDNGHPLFDGYATIARSLAARIRDWLPPAADGCYRVQETAQKQWNYLLRENKLWLFANEELVTQNGWSEATIKNASPRDLEAIPLLGSIRTVDPVLFGPQRGAAGR